MDTNTDQNRTAMISMDDIPMNNFHRKVFACCAGCPFMDGYVLGIISIALSIMTAQFTMSSVMSGLVGTGTLVGMFIGALFGGNITDRIGRKKMFFWDFLFITIVAVLQALVTTPIQVFIFRVLIGLGLGADYGIAGPYIAEFIPQKKRGAMIGLINAFWYIGYAVSFIVGYVMLPIGSTTSWRWMLITSAVPSLIWLLARSTLPESPRWLISKGRAEEANAIIKSKFGDNVYLPEEPEIKKVAFSEIFKHGYGRWVTFAITFWTLLVIPTFGIGTYIPTIMQELGFVGGNIEYLGSAVMNIFYLAGLIPIYFLMDSWGRRPTLIWIFLISGVALAVLGATSGMHMPFAFILIMFIIYGAANTAGGAHEWVYPNELFPTHIRATAVGFITAITRIASAITTFLCPAILASVGAGGMLYICAGLSFVGMIVTIAMAPETKHLDLKAAGELATKSK